MGPYRRFKNLTFLFTLLWMCVFLTSCATLSGCSGCNVSHNYTKPFKPHSFTLLQVKLNLTPVDCTVKELGTSCNDILRWLPPKSVDTVGSGTIVKVANNKTYVLTAEHVCNHEPLSSFEMKFQPDPAMPPLTAVVTVQQHTDIIAVDAVGEKHESTIFAADASNDVCVVQSDGRWGEGRIVKVAEELPDIGAKVYNIAAPFGIFSPGEPGVKLHFEGRYSGYDGTGNHFYTLPARPGSSGSSVLDEKGRIIGVVHSAMIGFEHVALSSSLNSVKALVDSIPDQKPKEPHADKVVLHKLLFGF